MHYWGRISRSTRMLLLLTLAWAVVQVVVLWPIGRYLTYDEAIYLSQVYPDVASLRFSAPRSRGITWLLAPVAVFEPSVGIVRAYAVALSAGMFFVAFRAWQPVLGRRVLLAAALFGGCWLTLFYGAELYPNLPVALGAVAATGYLARHLTADGPAWPSLALAAAATAFVTLIRPVDGTLLAVALALAVITRQVRVLAIRWAAIGGAMLVAWVPWVVEAYQSYGGLRERFEDASVNVGSGDLGPFDIVWRHLLLTEGPLHGPDMDTLPVVGALSWLLLAAGVLAASWHGLRRHPELRAPVLAALAFAAEYVLITSVVTARFLLPVYALAAICVAATVPSITSARVRTVGAVILVAWLGWNVAIAASVNETEDNKRSQRLALGKALRTHANGRECVLIGQGNYPEIAFAAGCYGVRFKPGEDRFPVPAARRDATVFVLTMRPPDRLPLLREPGKLWPVDVGESRDWWLFEPDGRDMVRWQS